VAGAKWITNEVDKQILKESVKIAAASPAPVEHPDELVKGPALQVLDRVQAACSGAADGVTHPDGGRPGGPGQRRRHPGAGGPSA
jgi:hypothetical protein